MVEFARSFALVVCLWEASASLLFFMPGISLFLRGAIIYKRKVVRMSKDFERIDSNSTASASYNTIPVPGDFYAIRKPDYSYDPDRGVATVEYFLFKKDENELRPATLRQLKRAAILKPLLADCEKFRKKTLENVLDKKFDIVVKICGDKVLTFGDKESATVSNPSDLERAIIKQHTMSK